MPGLAVPSFGCLVFSHVGPDDVLAPATGDRPEFLFPARSVPCTLDEVNWRETRAVSRGYGFLGWGMWKAGWPGWCRLGACLLAWHLAPLYCAEPESPNRDTDRSPPAILELVNGDRVAGRLVDIPAPNMLGWRLDAFTSPFQFPVTGLKSCLWPDLPPARLRGDYRCELAGGDVLTGTLLDLREEALLLDVIGIGPLHIDLSLVRRLSGWDRPGNALFRGPGRPEEWQQTGTEWTSAAGELISAGPNSRLRRDLPLPARGRIEFVLSWEKRLDCDFAIGVATDDSAAFQFEVWNDAPAPPRPASSTGAPSWGEKLALVRTTEMAADATIVQSLEDCRTFPEYPGSAVGRIHLLAYYDRAAGRMRVHSSGGELLAELQLPDSRPSWGNGLLIQNHAGDLRIERIEVHPWDGVPPARVTAGHSLLLRDDGSQIDSQVIAFDPDRRTFEVQTGTGLLTLPERELADIGGTPNESADTGTIRARFLGGQSLSGDLVSIEEGAIRLTRVGIRETITLPVRLLHSLTPVANKTGNAVPAHHNDSTGEISRVGDSAVDEVSSLPNAQPIGCLQLAGWSLRGRLIENNSPDEPGLTWKPACSTAASQLRPGVVVAIDYNDPRHPRPSIIPGSSPARPIGSGTGADSQGTPRSHPHLPSLLHLRSGEKIACNMVAITEEGVTLESPQYDQTFLSHRAIAALDLQPGTDPGWTPSPRYTSLLTLPRSERANPPTHLVHAVDGDCLRCRVLSLKSGELQVEMRQQTRHLPRERVTRIQWLHPEGVEPGPVPAANANPGMTRGHTIRALLENRLRVSLEVEQVVGDLLVGRSHSLGNGRVDLARTVRLDINPPADTLAGGESPEWAGWKLRPAISPRNESEDDGTTLTEATSGIGKAAPEFQLDLLGGGRFSLVDLKGEIVVIDFWASWCGPCLRVMPQVAAVVREFSDSAVRLIGVNIEESAEIAGSTLDQLRLSVPVALDSDGSVARKYGVTEIPQTVIIDRSGKVARVLIGDKSSFADDLRTALEAITSQSPGRAR